MRVLLVGALALAACASPGPGPYPETLYQAGFDAAIAEAVAARCPAYALNTAARDAYIAQTQQALREDGVSEAQLEAWAQLLPTLRLELDLADYLDARGIVVDEPRTFCAAGAAEIAAGTNVGRLLRQV